MSREDDATIARWRGMERTHYIGKSSEVRSFVPNYTLSDADAITLLPVLVERTHASRLYCLPSGEYDFSVWPKGGDVIQIEGKPTIASTISSGVLELIRRESCA